jgi:hypothetical protein
MPMLELRPTRKVGAPNYHNLARFEKPGTRMKD